MAALPDSVTMVTDKQLAGREAPAAGLFSDWLELNLFDKLEGKYSLCH